MKKVFNNFSIFKVSLFFLLLFLAFKQSPRFDYEDYGVYYHYSKSVVEDGSLNISNELRSIREERKEPVILTPTYFDPNFHSHGIAVPYSLIYLASKKVLLFLGLSEVSPKEENDLFRTRPWEISRLDLYIQSIMAISSLFFLLLSFRFLYSELKNDYKKSDVLTALGFLFFSTSLYMYSIVLPGNASFIAAILGMPLLVLVVRNFEGEDNSKILLFYLACCVVVKIDFVFYLLIIPFLFIKNQKSTLYGIGLGLVLGSLLVINKYLQYGELHLSYGGVSSNFFILFDILFAPISGYLYTNPIYLLLVFFIFTPDLLKSPRARILQYLLLIPVIKVVSEGFTFSSGVDFGARSHLVDFGLWAYIFCEVLKNTKYKKFFAALSISCMVWTMTLVALYGQIENKQNYSYVFFHVLNLWKNIGPYFYEYLSSFAFIKVKLVTSLIFILIYAFIRSKVNKKNYFMCFSSLFCLFYLLLTIVNFSTSGEQEAHKKPTDFVTGDKRDWYFIETKEGIEERIDYLINRNSSSKEIEELIKIIPKLVK